MSLTSKVTVTRKNNQNTFYVQRGISMYATVSPCVDCKFSFIAIAFKQVACAKSQSCGMHNYSLSLSE